MAEHHLPAHLRYTSEHDWVSQEEGSVVRVGITDYAQAELGDIVFVQLPPVGSQVSAGDTCGELESTKSVSDLFAPVSGTVHTCNDALTGSPELVNTDPYGHGWLLEIHLDDPQEVLTLLDAEGYRSAIG